MTDTNASLLRVMRDRGASRDLQACALWWENNNATDAPVNDTEQAS